MLIQDITYSGLQYPLQYCRIHQIQIKIQSTIATYYTHGTEVTYSNYLL